MKLALGQDNFQLLRASGAYFVDKSNFIAEFWRDNALVLLLPRPRRFGKSLNMSMLKYFFSSQHQGRDLFEGLAIEQDAELMAEQGQHPVIHISLKNACRASAAASIERIGALIAETYSNCGINPKQYLAGDKLKLWQQLQANEAGANELMDSLLLYSELLHHATGRRTLILVDEYDAPLFRCAQQ